MYMRIYFFLNIFKCYFDFGYLINLLFIYFSWMLIDISDNVF